MNHPHDLPPDKNSLDLFLDEQEHEQAFIALRETITTSALRRKVVTIDHEYPDEGEFPENQVINAIELEPSHDLAKLFADDLLGGTLLSASLVYGEPFLLGPFGDEGEDVVYDDVEINLVFRLAGSDVVCRITRSIQHIIRPSTQIKAEVLSEYSKNGIRISPNDVSLKTESIEEGLMQLQRDTNDLTRQFTLDDLEKLYAVAGFVRDNEKSLAPKPGNLRTIATKLVRVFVDYDSPILEDDEGRRYHTGNLTPSTLVGIFCDPSDKIVSAHVNYYDSQKDAQDSDYTADPVEVEFVVEAEQRDGLKTTIVYSFIYEPDGASITEATAVHRKKYGPETTYETANISQDDIRRLSAYIDNQQDE